ncbi:MAG: hypothetical protein R3C18_13490 [Planctomycetaceae bacterium]
MQSTPALPKFCPDCGHEFHFLIGLCGHRFMQAIAIQSARSGVEIQCRYCKNMFVLTRSEQLPRPRKAQRKSKKSGNVVKQPVAQNGAIPSRETQPVASRELDRSHVTH